jgi:hypothetical protein
MPDIMQRQKGVQQMGDKWRRYRIVWKLGSPLHIGYRTIGTIAQTRLWVPGRNVWGAMIDTLARIQGATAQNPGKFKELQHVFKESLCFEAWFLTPEEGCNVPANPWYPIYKSDGLYYGKLKEDEMQRVVLGANVSTAIDHTANIADEGNLFEVEYVAPQGLFSPYKGNPIWIIGHLWAHTDTKITINGDVLEISDLFNQYLVSLSIGGEQRQGYGCLTNGTISPGDEQTYQVNADGDYIIPKNEPFPFLISAQTTEVTRGKVEPIVGRSTNSEKQKGHGATLEDALFCWLPGSINTRNTPLHFIHPGIGAFKI